VLPTFLQFKEDWHVLLVPLLPLGPVPVKIVANVSRSALVLFVIKKFYLREKR
jgi:hypothetical protein